MSVDVVARLAAMDRDELRFRVICEARKLAGRVRHAVRPPHSDRRRLARLLDPAAGPLVAAAAEAARRGDPRAAHRALASHMATRTSRWPLQSSRRATLVQQIHDARPHAAAEARRRGDRIVQGRLDLLGYHDVQVGNPPDWHADVVHGRRAPIAHWTRVPYLDSAIGDHKVIWEINRHQYWLELGVAYWLTGDRRYRDVAIAHLEDWIARNPPETGVNWASMLELAFRTLSWTWAVEFFAGDDAEDTPWLVDLLVSLDAQLTHVSRNLSRYFSPNTHLSGEALALYCVSAAFPELRGSDERMADGRAVLLREAARQVQADGGHVELSAHYHRYTTDFYLLALMVARAAGDPAAAVFETTVRRAAAFLRTIADDRGTLPLIGDDDGGQLFRFGGRPPVDASATLASAATLLGDPALSVGTAPDDAYWILGGTPSAPAPRGPWPSRVLADSGYFVSRGEDGAHLIFDAGRHGFLNGGHAHGDALAVVLRVAGEPLLVDPGTATYVMDAGMRDRLRSPRMHNTVVLDGRDYAIPSGPFQWQRRADARLLVARTGGGCDFAAGTHDGDLPRRHTRAVVSIHGIGWLIVDRVTGDGSASADAWWHLHPDWQAAIRARTIALRSSSGRHAGFATTAREVGIESDPAFGAYSPEYGRVEQGVTIRARHTGPLPFTFATFIAATESPGERVTIADRGTMTRDAWIGCGFAIGAGARELSVEVAFPFDPTRPPGENWPQPCIEQLARTCVE